MIYDSIFLFTLPRIEVLLMYLAIVLLLGCSAFISGSEVAFFSLNDGDRQRLRESGRPTDRAILRLLEQPQYLLATILIANNFANIAIVTLSTFTIDDYLATAELAEWLVFLINMVLVTFLLLFFGEIAPKVYATSNNLKLARIAAKPMLGIRKALMPVSWILVNMTSIVERGMQRRAETMSYSNVEIEEAINLTMQNETRDEAVVEQQTRVLKNIIRFSNNTVKKVMRSRVDILAVDYDTEFYDLLEIIRENNYSRIPIYKENLDQIEGVLYVKDLIEFLDKDNSFEWQQKIQPPFFAFEDEPVSHLLHRFKEEHKHLAIVLDEEYGGVAGLVTLEDVLEEITGEISDEFDTPDTNFTQIKPNHFLFEGKTPLNDVCRIAGLGMDVFEKEQEEVDSLGGLLIHLAGDLPKVSDKFEFKNLRFEVVAANDRSVQQVDLKILPEEEN